VLVVTARPGDRVEVRFTKWGGGRHWEFPLVYLGSDENGHWAEGDVGTVCRRPDASFTSAFPWVTLFPRDEPWVASFYDSAEQPTLVYVDMTTVPVWSGDEVVMVDLDLDVILGRDGSLLIDDEDEFALQRVSLGYPDEIVAMAEASAAAVVGAIRDGREPFG
jgi:uncharacterized protein